MATYIIQEVVQHEYIHQLIYEKYGIDSNVTYNFWPAAKEQFIDVLTLKPLYGNNTDIDNMEAWAWVTPDYSNTNATCNDTCRSLHTQLEITDSQTSNIVSVLFSLFLLYFMYKEIFATKQKEYIFIEKEEEEEPRFMIYD